MNIDFVKRKFGVIYDKGIIFISNGTFFPKSDRKYLNFFILLQKFTILAVGNSKLQKKGNYLIKYS